MFRKLRILILLLVLLSVALGTWLGRLRVTDWSSPLWVAIYPINADGSPSSASTVSSLQADDFAEIGDWFAAEAQRWGRDIRTPLIIKLGPVVDEMPPTPPANRSALSIALWSLKFRYWAATHDDYAGPPPDIRLFVLYHAPVENLALPHSLGLEKGRIGLVNAFATPALRTRNNIVIAHELLHTLGATDKYDLANNLPRYPDGFAEPDAVPRYPQRRAEIMAGRTPITATEAEMPDHLTDTVVGRETALEIRLAK